MTAYELTRPYTELTMWVVGDATDVARAIAGFDVEAQRLSPNLHLHPSHAEVDYTLPRDEAHLRAQLAKWG